MARKTVEVLPPERKRDAPHVHVTISKGPGELGQIIGGLAVVCVVGFVVYWLLANVLLPLIGNLLLIALMALSGFVTWKRLQEPDPSYPQDKPGLEAMLEEVRKTKPDMTEEKFLKGATVGGWVAIGVYGLLATVVAAYALDPHYQRVPLNYLGFATVAAMLVTIILMMRKVVRLPKLKTESWQPTPPHLKAVAFVAQALCVVYPLSIFMVKFGVL